MHLPRPLHFLQGSLFSWSDTSHGLPPLTWALHTLVWVRSPDAQEQGDQGDHSTPEQSQSASQLAVSLESVELMQQPRHLNACTWRTAQFYGNTDNLTTCVWRWVSRRVKTVQLTLPRLHRVSLCRSENGRSGFSFSSSFFRHIHPILTNENKILKKLHFKRADLYILRAAKCFSLLSTWNKVFILS